jgi:DNA polymerase-1
MKTSLLHSSTIRDCFIADPGMHIFSCDFDQIEMRIAAGFADETILIEASKRGESLHKTAAVQLFGTDYTKDQYRYTKNVNFGWLYGGGPKTLSEQTGISFTTAADIVRRYEGTFKKLAKLKYAVQERVVERALGPADYLRYQTIQASRWSYREAGQDVRPFITTLLRDKMGWIKNPYGRKLLVEANHAYAGLNYLVQSTARDIFGDALLRIMDDRELEQYALLPIHDELLGQAPIDIAEEIVRRYAAVMSTEFMGVPLTASGKVYGTRWGDGYK